MREASGVVLTPSKAAAPSMPHVFPHRHVAGPRGKANLNLAPEILKGLNADFAGSLARLRRTGPAA
jgi:hypothetical protein